MPPMSPNQKASRVRAAAVSGEARATRLSARLSLRELANEVGVHPTCLRSWEVGEFLPRHENAVRWYQALNRLGWRP